MEPIVLYEDDDVLAVNKPSGLVVHSDGKTKEPNLVEWLLSKYPNIRDVGEPGGAPSGAVQGEGYTPTSESKASSSPDLDTIDYGDANINVDDIPF
jgi:hypothetical protein